MTTPYHALVADYARLLRQGRAYPLGIFPPAPRPQISPDAPVVLFFAPHPDDECIVGAVAVRLLRQARMKVVNVAVTQGSRKDRQTARFEELRNACHYLGFDLLQTQPGGLERINPKSREQDPAHWAACVKIIQAAIEVNRPKVVVCPHDRDWNSTHIGTHYLVMDALRRMPPAFECYVIETEFWGAMSDPNLMLEVAAEDLADMIAATTFHVGEVHRNPYHLLLPPWMMDNVRRGAEIVGGQGGVAPHFDFAALYRLRRWSHGQLTKCLEGSRQVPAATNLGDLLV